VHRIGRTARAGKSGHAISFCDVEEKGLLKQVERTIKFEIPRERVPNEVPKSDEAAVKSGSYAQPVAAPRQETQREPRREARPEPRHEPRREARPEPRHEPRPEPRAEPRPDGPRHFAGPNARRPQPSERSHPGEARGVNHAPRDASRDASRDSSRDSTQRAAQNPHGFKPNGSKPSGVKPAGGKRPNAHRSGGFKGTRPTR
jgi:superfamily II DNA/RNA helicase